MTTIAVETANKIDRFLFERSADIKVLSESNMLIDPEIKESIRLDFLSSVMKAYQTYDSIFVLNLEGDIILSTGEIPDINTIKKEFMSEEAYISDIFRQRNGEEAFDIVKTNHIDIVVSDIRMPKLDKITPVRVSAEVQSFGLDSELHGEEAYYAEY